MKTLGITSVTMTVAFTVSCIGGKMNTELVQSDDLYFSVACSAVEQSTTKSSNNGMENHIDDVCAFVFTTESEPVSVNYFPDSKGISGRSLFVNDALGTGFDDAFNVYLLANVGDVTRNESLYEDGILSEACLKRYTYRFSETYDEFSLMGYPMASSYMAFSPRIDKGVLMVDKLVTRYRITFTQSDSNTNAYEILAGQIHDVSRHARPFVEDYATPSTDAEYTMHDGDSFSLQDIVKLNTVLGTKSERDSADLFVLENVQGLSFPAGRVKTERDKKEENIFIEKKGLCSYIEFDIRVTTPTAVYHDVKYRYYFGDSLLECGIPRNSEYTMCFNFDNVLVEDEGWRIEPSEPEVNEDVLRLDRSKLTIIKGMDNDFRLFFDEEIGYEMSYDVNKAGTLGVSIVKTKEDDCDMFTVSTNYNNGNTYSYISLDVEYDDLPIIFTTPDGLVRKVFTLRVIKSRLPFSVDCINQTYFDSELIGDLASCVDFRDNTTLYWSLSGNIICTSTGKIKPGANTHCYYQNTHVDICDSGEVLTSEDKPSYCQRFLVADMHTKIPSLGVSLYAKMFNLSQTAYFHYKNIISAASYHIFIPTAYDFKIAAGFKQDGVVLDIPMTCIHIAAVPSLKSGVYADPLSFRYGSMASEKRQCWTAFFYANDNSTMGVFDSESDGTPLCINGGANIKRDGWYTYYVDVIYSMVFENADQVERNPLYNYKIENKCSFVSACPEVSGKLINAYRTESIPTL